MEKTVSKSGLATAGLVLGIIAVLLSAVPIINNFAALLALFALVFGIVGIMKVKKGKKRGKGTAVSAVVLAVVALVVVFASQSFYGAVLDEAGKEVTNSLDKATGKKTDELLGKDVDVDFGKFMVKTDEYGLNETSLQVTVTNNNKETKSYSITVEALDKEGVRIADDTIYASDLKSGQSQKEKVFEYVDDSLINALKKATFKVSTVSQT